MVKNEPPSQRSSADMKHNVGEQEQNHFFVLAVEVVDVVTGCQSPEERAKKESGNMKGMQWHVIWVGLATSHTQE